MKKYIIGVEIGGTKLQLAIGTLGGEIVEIIRGTVAIEDGAKGILAWIKDNFPLIQERLAQINGIAVGIGCGFGGPVDSGPGRVIKSVHVQGWDSFPLKRWFEENFGLSAIIANDTNAAAWGEYCLGSGRGTKQFFYTNIGTGIGGGLILNGELYDGQGYGAGEFGQTYVPDWTASVPGKEERLENLCSGMFIEKRLRTCDTIPDDSLLLKYAKGSKERITTKMLHKAALNGDKFSQQEIDHVARTLGIGLSNVLSLFNPEVIAIGGGVSKMGETLLKPVREYTKAHEFVSSTGRYKIVQCELGESIVVVGAILLASEIVNK